MIFGRLRRRRKNSDINNKKGNNWRSSERNKKNKQEKQDEDDLSFEDMLLGFHREGSSTLLFDGSSSSKRPKRVSFKEVTTVICIPESDEEEFTFEDPTIEYRSIRTREGTTTRLLPDEIPGDWW